IGRLLQSILAVARRHNLAISIITLRYFRAVLTIETLILTLDPGFAFREQLRRTLLEIEIRTIRRRSTPDATATALIALLGFAQTLPQRLMRSSADLDEMGRTIGNSVGTMQSALGWLLRACARLAGLAVIALIINLAVGFVPLSVESTWLWIAALIA